MQTTEAKLTTKPTCYFLEVQDRAAKCWRLYKTVQTHYLKKETVLITVSTWEVAQFVDKLLWEMEPDAFLPHCSSTAPCREAIVITSVKENLNQASVAINLATEPLELFSGLHKLYELYDHTHPLKIEQANQRREFYQQLGLETELI